MLKAKTQRKSDEVLSSAASRSSRLQFPYLDKTERAFNIIGYPSREESQGWEGGLAPALTLAPSSSQIEF